MKIWVTYKCYVTKTEEIPDGLTENEIDRLLDKYAQREGVDEVVEWDYN